MDRFVEYGTSSFDSSGWMRTAGYGNVYLPFRGRRNVTNGASALTCGPGLSAREFYALCEETGHDSPFCTDYKRIQTDRFARMWDYYLAYCEGAFQERHISDVQLMLTKSTSRRKLFQEPGRTDDRFLSSVSRREPASCQTDDKKRSSVPQGR